MKRVSNTSTVRCKIRNDLLAKLATQDDERSLSELLNDLLKCHLSTEDNNEKTITLPKQDEY
ncbi:hypothetical protein U9608_001229 [Vibrio alginolyticus]|uniref:hypothetical protein n=1 Tax=Vibrio alginolyticus TaxID=663 RepID=UPI00280855F3|nr:hypothetical protein [Vibrio parahaemolyticus]EMB9233733.1 hypothetical protein [Vibrio alginolyticus]